MNTGLLLVGGFFSSDNSLTISLNVSLSLNYLADAEQSWDRWDSNPRISWVLAAPSVEALEGLATPPP
jgi:hypothetical protein